MSKILADATAGLEYIIETGMNIGFGAFILKLIAHVGYYSGYVGGNVLGSCRVRHPEKLMKAIAEGNIPARVQKLIILFPAAFIIAKKMNEPGWSIVSSKARQRWPKPSSGVILSSLCES